MRQLSVLPLLAVLVVAASTTACSISVPLVNPKPNIDLDKSGQNMHVEFGQSVQDTFTIPPQNGIQSVDVKQWRQTLKNGFLNGFGDAFALTERGPTALTLEISDASPSLTPAAVSGYSGVVAVNAQITFKARVLANAQIVCRSNGTVESKTSVNNPNQVKDVVRSAVEGMYEVISKECFEHHGAPPPPPVTGASSKKI